MRTTGDAVDRRGGHVEGGDPSRPPGPRQSRQNARPARTADSTARPRTRCQPQSAPGGPGRSRSGRVQPPRPLPTRLRLTRRARIALRALFGTASALVLVAAGAGWYLHSSVLGGLASSQALAGLRTGSQPGGGLNVLLMGLDSRRDNDGNDLPPAVLARLHAGNSSDIGGYNTNTLILLHIPADGSHAVALSVPRDDYVDLPEGLGWHKIKEAYGRAKENAEAAARSTGTSDRLALERLGREAGRHATIDAVQQLLGVTVDHFAEINLVGFYDLANALGGVTVCLRQPVSDWYSGADFPAGVQSLDGAQSLAFVRQRHGLANGDLDRTHRQQAFLASAVYKLRHAGVFNDLSKIGALLDVVRKDVVIDSGFDLLPFIHRASAVTSGNVTFYTLPIKGFAMADGESVNLIDPAQVREVAQRLLDGRGPVPSEVNPLDSSAANAVKADARSAQPRGVNSANSLHAHAGALGAGTAGSSAGRLSAAGSSAAGSGASGSSGVGSAAAGPSPQGQLAGAVSPPPSAEPNISAPPGIPCVN